MTAMANNKKSKNNHLPERERLPVRGTQTGSQSGPSDFIKKSVSENEQRVVQNEEEIPDSFSEALLGTHSDLPAARLPNERLTASRIAQAGGQVGEYVEVATEPEISPRGDFLDSAYPENILTSITQAHSPQEPIA